jgi:hypothetical protein
MIRFHVEEFGGGYKMRIFEIFKSSFLTEATHLLLKCQLKISNILFEKF